MQVLFPGAVGGGMAAVVISGSPPDATLGQPYDYLFPITGPTRISSADAALLASHNFTFNGTNGHLTASNPA